MVLAAAATTMAVTSATASASTTVTISTTDALPVAVADQALACQTHVASSESDYDDLR